MAKTAAKLSFLLMAALLTASTPVLSEETTLLTYPASFFAGAQLATAYDMVGRLPGFVYISGNNNRGYSGTAGNVLVDGHRPTAKTDDLTTILQRIPVNQVDHIDVIRGGAPGIDMQGQPVVANVVRKAEDSTALILTLNNDFYTSGHDSPYGSVEYIRKTGGASYDLTFSRLGTLSDDFIGDGTESFLTPGQPATVVAARRTGPDRMGWSLNGAATWPLLGGSFGVNLTMRSSAHNETLYYAAPMAATYLDSEKVRAGELGLHWDGDIGPLEVNLVGLERLNRNVSYEPSSDWTGVSLFDSLRDTDETILRATARYHVSPDLTIESGAEGAYNTLDGHTSDVVNAVPQSIVGADAQVHEIRSEIFAQGSWTISPDWSLEAGSRAEFSTITANGVLPRSFAFLKPRLLLSWSPWDGQQFRLRMERVVGQLDFSNFIATANVAFNGIAAGNSNLKPDQRWQMEGDYEWHFWDKGALTLSILHEDITDLVDYVPLGNGQDGPGNIPKAINNQFDIEFALPLDKVGLDGGQFKGSLLWRDSALADPVTGETRPISNVNDRNLLLSYVQDVPGLNSTLNLGAGLPFTRPSYRIAQVTKLRLDLAAPYFTASWDYKPKPDLDILFQARNFMSYVGELEQDDYAGPRNVSGLSQIDDLNIQTVALFSLQLRKTF
jgi:hypothetical protein